jgi:hypothetical protein
VMKLAPFVRPERYAPIIHDLRVGLSYAGREPVVRVILLLVGTVSLFGMAFSTQLPAWAVDVLGGDATTNGLLQSARGVGSLIGAVWIASLGRFTYKGKLLTIGTFVMPITLLVFSQVRWLPLSLLVLVIQGLAFIPIVNLANALVQTRVPDIMRGRVMGIYTLIFMGMWPVGGLWSGKVAEVYGEPAVVIIGGVVVLALAIGLYIFVPTLRKLE